MSDQIEAIDRAGKEYRAALETGDIDGVMALWADDGVWMPPGRPSIVGAAAIRKAYQELFFDPFLVKKYDIAIQEIVVAGEWAFERSTFQIALKPKSGGGDVEWAGKYVIVWKVTDDGNWKLARAINNSDLPEGHTAHK